MATQLQLTSFAHFEKMVSKPTWKDILLELISSNSVDPWNIDLVSLADAFIEKVRDMEKMDFAVQANVILAASILLKYKSDYLKFLSYQSGLEDFPAEPLPEPATDADFPELSLSSRIPPKRQITAEELISEMERIIKYEDVERVRIPRGSITETFDIELPERNIETDLRELLEKITASLDSEGWCLFSELVSGKDTPGLIYTLLCLLHLVQEDRIDLMQEKMFGEILIHIKEGKAKEEKIRK